MELRLGPRLAILVVVQKTRIGEVCFVERQLTAGSHVSRTPRNSSLRSFRCGNSASAIKVRFVDWKKTSDEYTGTNGHVGPTNTLDSYGAARSKINRPFHSLITFLGIQERPLSVASPEVGEDDHTCNRRVRTP